MLLLVTTTHLILILLLLLLQFELPLHLHRVHLLHLIGVNIHHAWVHLMHLAWIHLNHIRVHLLIHHLLLGVWISLHFHITYRWLICRYFLLLVWLWSFRRWLFWLWRGFFFRYFTFCRRLLVAHIYFNF